MKKNILFICILCLFLVSQITFTEELSYRSYFDKEHNFVVSFPDNWQFTVDLSDEVYFLAFNSQEDEEHLLRVSIQENSFPLDLLEQAILSQSKKDNALNGYSVKKVMLDGREALRMIFIAEEEALKSTSYFFKKGNELIILNLTSLNKAQSKNKQLAKQIANRFEYINFPNIEEVSEENFTDLNTACEGTSIKNVEYQTYYNEEFNYKINFPKTWRYEDSPSLNLNVFAINEECDQEIGSLFVTDFDYEVELSYENLSDFLLAFFQDNSEVTIVEEEDLLINEKKVKKIVLSPKAYEGLRSNIYFFMREGKIIALTLASPNEDFPFKEIIKSFEFQE
ncbi:MAG: PsbP-related protein [Candidatus Woesearchaeota archaeon]